MSGTVIHGSVSTIGLVLRAVIPEWMVAAGLVAACLASGLAAAREPRAKDEATGGHPLAGRSGSLADLLEMPDWQTPASPPGGAVEEAWPSSDPAPEVQPDGGRAKLAPEPLVKPRPPAHGAAIDFQSLIDKRNTIIDGCDLFETMERIYREEAVLAQHFGVQQRAAAELNAANVARNQVYALGKAGQQHRGPADDRVRNAQRNLLDATAAAETQRGVLAPLYEQINPHLGPWLQTYREMRASLKPDRRDPDRTAVLAALEAATAQRQDFYEGHVLAALAQAYGGDADGAETHLAKACEGYARLRLFGSLLGPDCCEGYLLLGKPDMVQDYVDWIKRLGAGKRQNPRLCWLVGQAAMLAGKDNDAKTFFDRALAKAGAFRKENPQPVAEPLLGEAAFFYATTSNDKLRNLDKAKELLAKAPAGSECWQVLRAKVAVHAAEGAYDHARTALAACRERAPAVLDESLTKLLADARP